MATATKTKKKTKKPAKPRRRITPRGPAKASTNGDSAKLEKGTDDDSKQTYLKDFEPERDATIEKLIDPWIDAAKKKENAEADISDSRTKITGLLRDKGLSSYKYKGYTVRFKPGDDTAQLSKPKQK